MRLWSLHPQYLDPAGLVAAWREALLAQKVLRGKTRGYQHHPQLQRFRQHPQPDQAIAAFLQGLYNEAQQRGYNFDQTKIITAPSQQQIAVTQGQIAYEWQHLLNKLQQRNPQQYQQQAHLQEIQAHPLFDQIPGPIESWEKI
jgi:hypothetical protein